MKPDWPMPILKFARNYCRTQREAAQMLRVAAPTLSLWISRGRQIFVVPGPDGVFTYYEVRAERGAA